MTHDEVGIQLLGDVDAKVSVDPADRNARYQLIICEDAEVSRAVPHLDPDGSMLAFFPRLRPVREHPGLEWLEQVARIRCSAGEWRLLRLRELAASDEAPDVSLIVTTQDQLEDLAGLLAILTEEPESPTWEIVIVDRGSFDSTPELLRQIGGDVQAFRAPRGTTLAQAEWAAASRARADLLLFVDTDVRPTAGIVAALCDGAKVHPLINWFAGLARGDDGATLCWGCDAAGTWVTHPAAVRSPHPLLYGVRKSALGEIDTSVRPLSTHERERGTCLPLDALCGVVTLRPAAAASAAR